MAICLKGYFAKETFEGFYASIKDEYVNLEIIANRLSPL